MNMTKLLERAFAAASKLPPKDQDALADWLLREMESEQRWSRSFAESQGALSKLAEEAIAEHRSGQTRELDPDKL
jgi:hypothetical protein